MVAAAVVAAGIGGAALSARASKSAASTASNAQERAAQLGIDQQNKQFETVQRLLSPFVEGGTKGMGGMMDLNGLNGFGAQQGAIAGIQASPMFGALAQQGEDAILANASATGGLRGGNVQGALAQFRPQMLTQLIEQQYARLGGLAKLGQASAAGVGAAGLETGDSIAKLLSQQGSAVAGNALAGGRADANMYNAIGGSLGTYAGLRGLFENPAGIGDAGPTAAMMKSGQF